jgi:iron complex transport system ATP-binding protein
MAILETRDLSIGYFGPRHSKLAVASGIELQLRAGELVCLLGPNGAGKSTLLRTLAGMQTPLAGEVLLQGENIHVISKPELARQLSVVLTERVTVGLLTSYEVVALGRSPHTNWTGALTDRDHAIVEEAIRAVGAEPLARRYVSELSDGERQKIMLARALAQEPVVMILDEITAFLDLPRRVEIIRILRDLAHHRKRAILLSTHDLELALSTADRIWLLPKGETIAMGAPEDLVLRGIFASAFSSEGVRFDEVSGSFLTHGSFHSRVGLTGDGVIAAWTRRALQRGGYRVTEAEECTVQITVSTAGDRATWDVSLAGQSRRYTSIEALLVGLSLQV